MGKLVMIKDEKPAKGPSILIKRDRGSFFMSAWSPTGKPVVPNNHTRLRQWALKPFGAQTPRLRRVIRPAAKSAEARGGYSRKSPSGVPTPPPPTPGSSGDG